MHECKLFYRSGKVETKMLEYDGNIVKLLRTDIPEGVDHIDFMPDFFKTPVGSTGFFLVPSILNDGHAAQTFFHPRENCECAFDKNNMAIYAKSDGDAALLAVVTGMPMDYTLIAGINNEGYYLYPRFILDCEVPPEDLEVHFLNVKGGTYSAIARRYRQYQLERKACLPLKERMKEYPVIEESAKGPGVRIRMAWKPVPPPVLEQTEENEPQIHVAITFDRACDIIDEFHRQGIENAEFCLVGWNKSGHDGRFPDIFPVEPLLGGEKGLIRLISKAQNYGYLICAHTNLLDSYTIAKRWRVEDIIKNPDGTPVKSDCWGGGQSYLLCPEAAHKRFADEDFNEMARLGFRGTHYLDVMSVATPRKCYDSQHPLSRRHAGEWRGKTLALAREKFGASGSEGSLDFCIGDLDFVLYTIFYMNPPMPAICDEFIPFWHIVYHGIVLYNSFCDTVNSAIKKDPALWLRNVECGGRPQAYYYSKFLSVGDNWMGNEDLGCSCDDELRAGVTKIKKEFDEYKMIRDLQYEFIEEHKKLDDNVFLIVYSNDAKLVVNRSSLDFDFDEVIVPAESFMRF